MRVLLVSHYALPHCGGIEVLVDREARLLRAAGHDVVVVTSDAGVNGRDAGDPGYRVQRVAAWNWPERRLGVPWPVFSPRLISVLYSHVRWCDAVHAHGLLYQGSALAVGLARLLGKPSLVTEHAGLAWYPPGVRRAAQRVAMLTLGRAVARLAGRCYAHHDRVIALLRHLTGSPARVRYLNNPLDRALFRPPAPGDRERARRALGWPLDRPVVLFVGRIMARKGVDLLLATRNPEFDLVLCGSGDPAVLAGHLGAGVSHIPPRPQPELVPLYHAADALVLPSRSEGGLPLVVQEALACGLPVLLSEDAAFAKYKGCAGLSFCRLTPEAVRAGLLAILSERGAAGGTKPAQNDAPGLDAFLSDEAWWLNELYSNL